MFCRRCLTADPDERANAVMDRLVARLGGMPDLEDYRLGLVIT